MPKFIVREGYAYYKPSEKGGYPAGSIVEIDEITVGDQQWKLEPVLEKEAEDDVEHARRLVDVVTTPALHVPEVLKPFGSALPSTPTSENQSPTSKKSGRPPKVKA